MAWYDFLFKRDKVEDVNPDGRATVEEEANYYGLTVDEYRKLSPEELQEHQERRTALLLELEGMGEPIYDHRGVGSFIYHTDEHCTPYNYEQAVRDDLPWYKHGQQYYPARESWAECYRRLEQEAKAQGVSIYEYMHPNLARIDQEAERADDEWLDRKFAEMFDDDSLDAKREELQNDPFAAFERL